MPFTQDVVEELNVLMHFSLKSLQQGIKIHSNAEASVIAAAQRLYDKGILSQADGGYLTDLGIEAAELADKLINIMNSEKEIPVG
jgi:uncharacterized protein (TIGR02647 family)